MQIMGKGEDVASQGIFYGHPIETLSSFFGSMSIGDEDGGLATQVL